jgi:hypothetical protein
LGLQRKYLVRDQSEVTFHGITVIPTSLARYSNDNICLSKYTGTFNTLRYSYLAEEHEKRQHGVASWRKLDQL